MMGLYFLDAGKKSEKNSISWHMKITKNSSVSAHKKMYWNRATSIHVLTAYCCFCALLAELRIWDGDHMSHKKITCLSSSLWQKCWIPNVSNGSQIRQWNKIENRRTPDSPTVHGTELLHNPWWNALWPTCDSKEDSIIWCHRPSVSDFFLHPTCYVSLKSIPQKKDYIPHLSPLAQATKTIVAYMKLKAWNMTCAY